MELHRIAAARGYFHWRMMLDGEHRAATATEYTETLAYERLQPSGGRQLDVALACLRYELYQYATHGKGVASPEDFMPFAPEKKEQSAKEINSALQSALGLRLAKKRRKKREGQSVKKSQPSSRH